MNIILLAPEDWLDENTVCLDDRRHEHIRGILKAQMGDSLRVGLLGGLRGSGTVVKLSDEHTHLTSSWLSPGRKCCVEYSGPQLKWGSLTFT